MQFFKWIALPALWLLTIVQTLAAEHHDHINHYRVTRSNYVFSTTFDMSADHRSIGSVVKSKFHLTSQYDSYDSFGTYEGTGICSLFCLGVIFTRGAEIYIYDAMGHYEGIIDGQFASLEPAKFSFYDAKGQRVAIAYLDNNRMGFSLVDPENSNLILARLTRNFVVDAIDNWDVVIYHPDRIPARMVKTFASFACDWQNNFKPDL
jgi:hypothetical protein